MISVRGFCFCILTLHGSASLVSQEGLSFPEESIFNNLADGDSLTVYQCHVVDPEEQRHKTAEYVPASPVPFTLTDKLVLLKEMDLGLKPASRLLLNTGAAKGEAKPQKKRAFKKKR